jgi:hypothetical protein
MSQISTSQHTVAQGLMPRLDACVRLIDSSEMLVLSHATVYAGFLSDLVENRIDPTSSSAIDMLGMVGEFCQLIEVEYAAKH